MWAYFSIDHSNEPCPSGENQTGRAKILNIWMRPKRGVSVMLRLGRRSAHHSPSNKEVSVMSPAGLWLFILPSECPHLHALIAGLHGEASCPRHQETYLSDDRGGVLASWSDKDLKVGPSICWFFWVGVKAQLKENRAERKQRILWELAIRANLFSKESEEWGKRSWEMETQRQRQRLRYSETKTGTKSRRHKREEPCPERQRHSCKTQCQTKAQGLTQIAEAHGGGLGHTKQRGARYSGDRGRESEEREGHRHVETRRAWLVSGLTHQARQGLGRAEGPRHGLGVEGQLASH